jgi:CheY-like chemotaxis protein
VLLVEDNALLARVTERHLASFGCSVIVATSGDDALARFYTDGPFEALVTDVVMPGMPGDRLARLLVETHPDLVAVVVTGYRDRLPDENDIPRVRLLEKPFARDVLRRTLQGLFGEREDP